LNGYWSRVTTSASAEAHVAMSTQARGSGKNSLQAVKQQKLSFRADDVGAAKVRPILWCPATRQPARPQDSVVGPSYASVAAPFGVATRKSVAASLLCCCLYQLAVSNDRSELYFSYSVCNRLTRSSGKTLLDKSLIRNKSLENYFLMPGLLLK